MLQGARKSSPASGLPTSRRIIEHKKRQLLEYHRKFQCRPHAERPPRPLTALPNSSTLSRSSLDSRLKSSRQTSPTLADSAQFRPFSQELQRCHDRSASPLSVIRTRSNCSFTELDPPSGAPLRSNFLRKGSTVDRTIIKNLLMSKLNSHAFQVPFSLSDAPQNSLFVQAMTSQVPLGLRDVVGAEEMLRMSQVVMGIDLKSVSLTERVRRAIEEERELRRPPTEEEQHPTLRSIKRW